MRYTYLPISVQDYATIFNSEETIPEGGGGLDSIRVYSPNAHFAKGGGLWSFIKGVGRRVLPFLKQYILPGLYNVGTSVASDVSQGNTTLRDSLKRRGLEEVERAVGRAARGGSALSKKRGRITKPKARKKRRRNERVHIYNNVFRH